MSVTVRMNIPNTDVIPVTLTITMTLGEWRQLREQMGSDYPAWKFSEAINNAAYRLERQVTSEAE
jgi:hypothetical protein